MPGVNGFNVGRDVTLSMITPVGLLVFPGLQRFTSRQMTDKRVSRPVNGSPFFIDIPAGWEGDFEVDRQDASFDSFFSALESGYYAGAGIAASTISETVADAVGGISVFQFVGVMLTFDDAGDIRADDVIKMKVGWRASVRQQLA